MKTVLHKEKLATNASFFLSVCKKRTTYGDMSLISILCNCVAMVSTSLEHYYHGVCAPMFANTFFAFPSNSVPARHMLLLICLIRWHYTTDVSKTSLVLNCCAGASPKEKPL